MKSGKYPYMTKWGLVMLTCRSSFLEKSDVEIAAICNGLGPKYFGWAVPDTIGGIRVTPSGNIHDEGYYEGGVIEDKKWDDRTFRDNMLRIVNMKPKQWGFMRKFRKWRIEVNYNAVKLAGGTAFNWKYNEKTI